jgi:hypothetical protein
VKTNGKPDPQDLDLSQAEWLSSADTERADDAIEIAYIKDVQGVEYIALRATGGDPADLISVFTRAEWDAFVAGVKDGEFDFQAPPCKL